MHILMIPSWYAKLDQGGTGRFFRDQAVALQSAGARVGVIAPQTGGETAYAADAADPVIATISGRADPVGPKWPGRNEWFWCRAGMRLYQRYVAANGVPDLIHAHCCWPAGMLASRIEERFSAPYMVTEHRTDFAEGRVRPWLRRRVDRVLARAAGKIVVSPQLGNLMVAQFPGSMTDWDFVPNVLSREFCREAPGPRPPDDPFIFLSVGHMNRRKNHVGLVRAFALAFRDAPSVRLVLIGDGPEAGAVRRTAQVLGIAPRVALSGALAVGEVRAAMAQAHALVLASTAETFGVVLIEGLACGLPAIATDSGGPAAIITAQNGLLVDGGSDRKLADAMLKLKENFKAYDPSGIRAAALEAYGPERIGRQILAIAQRARAARSPRN